MMMAMSGDATQSYWLTQGMARALGVNLSSGVLEGWLKRSELDSMVLRCQLCGCRARCTQWLAVNGAGATSLPDYCANKAELESLRGF